MTLPRKPQKSKSRAAMKALRRQQLIDATIGSIAKRGFAETTLALVAAEAGLSRGIVNFHFTSKKALLEETLQHLAAEYQGTWQAAVRRAGAAPAERLQALMLADFDPAVCSRKKIAVWVAFLGEAKSRPTYMTLCGARDQERLDAITELCRALMAEDHGCDRDAEAVAAGLAALGDGLYVDLLIAPKAFTRERARQTVALYLAALFPQHFPPPGH